MVATEHRFEVAQLTREFLERVVDGGEQRQRRIGRHDRLVLQLENDMGGVPVIAVTMPESDAKRAIGKALRPAIDASRAVLEVPALALAESNAVMNEVANEWSDHEVDPTPARRSEANEKRAPGRPNRFSNRANC